MSIVKKFYSGFQASNKEKFRHEIMFARKEESKTILEYFEDYFTSIKHDGLTYLGCKITTDEEKIKELLNYDYKEIQGDDTRVDLITARFRIQASENEPVEEFDFNLLFPKIIKNYYFQLSGNKYYAVYQLTDKNFYYSHRGGLFLKTLIMPLGLVPVFNSSFTSDNDNTYHGTMFLLNYFKSNSSTTKTASKNVIHHYLVKQGATSTINYLFNTLDDVRVTLYCTKNDIPIHDSNVWDNITIGKDIYLVFKKEGSQAYYDMLVTLVDALKSVVKNYKYVDDVDYWKRKVSGTATGSLVKANRSIASLERILDGRTIKNLKECPDMENKKDVYAILRWMMWNFHDLSKIDEVNIYNRRIRLFEYLFFNLLIKTSKVSYRILNSRVVDNKRLKTLFSNTPINYLVKTTLTNDLIRYSNSTSNLTTFSSLKWSSEGIQTAGGEGGKVKLDFRDVHPTYLGNIALNTASASDPGTTGSLCPMNQDYGDMMFKNELYDLYYNHTPKEVFKN